MASDLIKESTKKLFPTGTAWAGVTDGDIGDQIDGLSGQIEQDRLLGQQIKNDFFPKTTEALEEWETIYSLTTTGTLTIDQRIERLEAIYKEDPVSTIDGQNQYYALNQFNLVVRPLRNGEDPRDIVSENSGPSVFNRTGQQFNGVDVRFGNSEVGFVPFILTNGMHPDTVRIFKTLFGNKTVSEPNIGSQFGFPQFGGVVGYKNIERPSVRLPDEEDNWGLIYVIEGFNDEVGIVPLQRKADFFKTTFRIKPLFMWAIARVQFV